MWGILKKIKDGWSWIKFAADILGILGLLAIVSGLGASIGGGVWAVIKGVPIPIALMVGYCTFVGMVYWAMVPLAYRALGSRAPTAAKLDKSPVDYKIWSHIQSLSVAQAAYLWCGLDPNVPSDLSEIDLWANVMKDAIKRRELKVTLGEWADASNLKWAIMSPKAETTVLRKDLSNFAKSKGWEPDFLKDY